MIEDLNSLKVGQKIWLEAEIVKVDTIHNDLEAEDIAVHFKDSKTGDYNWMRNSAMKQAHLSLPTSTISIGDEVICDTGVFNKVGILESVTIDSIVFSVCNSKILPTPINPELKQLKELAEKYNFELVKKK